MKKILPVVALLTIGFAAGVVLKFRIPGSLLRTAGGSIVTPIGSIPISRPLDKFTIENLSKRTYDRSGIILDQPIATASAFTQYVFRFVSDGKTVTGLANIPSGRETSYPVIVQFRGFVPKELFTSGEGTRRSGEYFASQGFITLAPDFLGFGGSDMPDKDAFGERFETYTTALNLLASVSTVPEADSERIGVWGHSNGGQIALTALGIIGKSGTHPMSGKSVPLVLWAPVTKPFPYSILYYTDEYDDSGKMLRKILAEFEETYDTDLYAFTNYLSYLSGPVLLHQGEEDEEVPVWWSNEFVEKLAKEGLKADYRTYAGADHDLSGVWNTVVSEDVIFFRKAFTESQPPSE